MFCLCYKEVLHMKNLKTLAYVFGQLAVDLLLITLSVFCAFALRLADNLANNDAIPHTSAFFLCIPIVLGLYTLFYFALGVYRVYWPYASIRDLIRLIAAAFVSLLASYLIALAIHNPMPRLVYLFGGVLIVLTLFSFRWFLRTVSRRMSGRSSSDRTEGRVMIVGAGETGNYMLHEFKNNSAYRKAKVVCLVDDDPFKSGKTIYNTRVGGKTAEIPALAKKHRVDLIIFAIASCSAERRAEILSLCMQTGCQVRSVPPLSTLIDGHINMSNVQNVRIEDLLGREPICLNTALLSGSVKGKTVLVTGGGGSIGSELCRQLAKLSPKKLIILDIYENNAYEIQNELRCNHPELPLEVRIASVRDESKLDRLFDELRPQIIFHAAAHKHVPLMEDAPDEAVKNNIFGTLNTVRMADKYCVERFVMISTDKAVNPTNVMGATKRVCEMIVQTFDRRSETEFVAVRFGNVLGSNGSVIPLFKKQIEAGGPVTVTHPDIIRYFMTIPEAVSLVLQAGASAKGGEIFVLDMGKPVRIVSLAENLIRLSGHVPNVDIKIEFTGLRPGEKLFEELLMDEEGLKQTDNKLIHIGKPISLDEATFFEELEALRITAENGGNVIPLLQKIAPTFKAQATV